MDNYSSYIQMLRKNLKRRLPAMRYEHSLSVSFTCMALAMRYGTDLNQAEVAGLLHDCGKRFSDDIILKKCQKHGIPVSPQEEQALSTLHAKYGEWLARNRYQITDPEILRAIGCHTTGKPGMGTLDKILYIADYIEPRRFKAANLPQMRTLAFQDLDRTMYEILKSTLEYLKQKGGVIDPLTAEAYQYFDSLINGEQKEKKEDTE